jgi:hypothetical protein
MTDYRAFLAALCFRKENWDKAQVISYLYKEDGKAKAMKFYLGFAENLLDQV